jgi:hypothetical protein
VVAEFGQRPGTLADRLGHQSVWKSGGDYAEHVEYCIVCRDLDEGGDGLGGSR